MDPRARRAHVLVPVDFSPTSGSALQRAAEWAGQTAGELDVVHVVERGSGDAAGAVAALPHFLAMLERHADKQLAGLCGADGRPVVVHHHVAIGETSAEILRLADRLSTELIVMGATGSGGAKHSLGAVARNIANSASCAVVVVAEGEGDDPSRATIMGQPLRDGTLAAATRLGCGLAPARSMAESRAKLPPKAGGDRS